MPVALVPQLLNNLQKQLAGAIRHGELPVYAYRADNGRVFRMVRLRDIRLYRNNPLTMRDMARTLTAMMYSNQGSPPTRRAAAA